MIDKETVFKLREPRDFLEKQLFAVLPETQFEINQLNLLLLFEINSIRLSTDMFLSFLSEEHFN